MNFRKYNSIENSYRELHLESIKEALSTGQEFVVQEKVHGSNLSFITDGKAIETAKRTSLLSDEERFYNFQQVRDRYATQILTLFDRVKVIHPETLFITIYGELFGGSYPHKEVAKVKGSIRLQKGIYYAPHNDFYAFDIRINNEDYLNIEQANTLFEELNFVYAKTLHQGDLESCLAYPNAFQSKLAGWLGFPLLEDNIAEGVIIKPVEHATLRTGSRIILKHKNEKWAEKTKKKKIAREPVVHSNEFVHLQAEIETYITANRLQNVISKIGEVSIKDFGKVMGLFARDVLEDFQKDVGEAYAALEKKEQKLLTKHLNAVSSELIKKEL